jgi:oxygen-independent coproporphyrinogen-3 oxidase
VGFGVYLHIPFCSRRCDYCAFATWTDRDHLIERYMALLVTDIQRRSLPAASSVFVGGGTPTRVPAPLLAAALRAVPTAAGAEVTVECNPDDVTVEMFETFAEAGVNRISLGVQSMVPHVLETLGRRHRPENVERAVEAAAMAGIQRVNIDLIYGAPEESLDDWERTVRASLSLGVRHVSAYALTVEAGTPLAADPERHPDDDDLADKYELADELLHAAGLQNYEVSNWAVPGEECRHNILYWQQGDYAGVGCAAHGHEHGRRYWNLRTPDRWIAAVSAGESTEAGDERLDAEAQRIERLQLALRMRDGIPVQHLDIEPLDDLVTVEGDLVRLTRRGRLLANEIELRVK